MLFAAAFTYHAQKKILFPFHKRETFAASLLFGFVNVGPFGLRVLQKSNRTSKQKGLYSFAYLLIVRDFYLISMAEAAHGNARMSSVPLG